MHLEIVSPDKQLFAGEVVSARFPGTEGSFQVLNNHAPLIATLSEGAVIVVDAEGKSLQIEIKGGIAEVQRNKILVLAE